MFRIFKVTDDGDGDFFENEFHTRKSARQFCKKLFDRAAGQLNLIIVHPDGTEEKFVGYA
ncbi:MAG: hypothetical protein KDJ97_38855 [Anaerolineae bacterium]|nr:hypothetical protein [Anaerolineae bacterium]